MQILSFKTGHDPAACLLKNGKIVAAAEEERFIRVKHAQGNFPKNAIEYCLLKGNTRIDDIDYIVFAREKVFKTFLKVLWYFIRRPPVKNIAEFRFALALFHVQLNGIFKSLRKQTPCQQFFKIMGGRPRKIYSFDHHLCHAASAYFGSGFSEAAILTMDGKGEATSILLGYGRDGRIKVEKRCGLFSSLGALYSSFTELLGFLPNNGEYKVMGLAPYGKPILNFDDVIRIKDGVVWINTKYSFPPLNQKNLKKRFQEINSDYDFGVPEKNAHIAATLQEKLEKAALFYVKKVLAKNRTRNLCLAGGVALNVKMNKVIWNSGVVEKMFIQPAAGDMGNVLGAAWLLYFKKTGKLPEPLRHLYLGPRFSDEEIEKALIESGFSYRKSDDVSRDAALLVSKGAVVAWFQGRMEFGPRALGNRSVLADPRKPEIKDIVNLKVKFREPFRPFCPSFLEGKGEEIFENYISSPYMIMSFKVKDDYLNKIPAVVHIDGTARPQEVAKSTNKLYYDLIKYFYEITGVPVILNTSLNVKGEPIVRTPKEAMAFLKKTEVDALAIGPFIAIKQKPASIKN
jgi:carbamoyltransferase